LDTWAASTRPERMAIDAGCTWLGLSVRRSEKLPPDEATVEFIARYKVNGRAFRLHEVSRFRWEKERWFYVDGVFPEPAA
jgi:SEC-C motif-containing protein